MGSKKRYRCTRELIKIALEDMTQAEIARICRTQQSSVSAWKNGKASGTEQQLAPLIKRYGARLQRATRRTYLLAGVEEPGPGDPFPMAVVEGPVVFRHVFMAYALRTEFALASPSRGRALKRVAQSRWLLHEQPGPVFVLVRQIRRHVSATTSAATLAKFRGLYKELYRSRIPPPFRDVGRMLDLELALDSYIQCSVDSARWLSSIDEPCGLEELLDAVDKYDYGCPEDALTARFLVRKAMVERGHELPGLSPADRTSSL